MTCLRTAIRVALREGQCYAAVVWKPKPKEVTGIEALVASCVALAFTAMAIYILDAIAVHVKKPAPTVYVIEDWRPPIDRCPKTMPLWDCIKNAEYAKYE